MLTVADQKIIDSLVDENRAQREVIRELIRERIDTERYWGELMIKTLQNQ